MSIFVSTTRPTISLLDGTETVNNFTGNAPFGEGEVILSGATYGIVLAVCITIKNYNPSWGESLSATPFDGVTVSFNSVTGRLVLRGREPIEDYQRVIDSIQYHATNLPDGAQHHTFDMYFLDGREVKSNTVSFSMDTIPPLPPMPTELPPVEPAVLPVINMKGTTGSDTMSTGEGNVTLDGRAGNDTLTSGSGNNTLLGGYGHDILIGGSGNNLLDGGHGNDTIIAGSGNTTLIGEQGKDILTGGAGANIFQYNSADDSHLRYADVITNFDASKDTLDLSRLGLSDMNDVKFVQSGADTLVKLMATADFAIIMQNTSAASLNDHNVLLHL